MIEIPEMMRRAMEAQGKVDPDEVIAKAAALLESGELDKPEKPPVHPSTPTAVIEGQESLLGVMTPEDEPDPVRTAPDHHDPTA